MLDPLCDTGHREEESKRCEPGQSDDDGRAGPERGQEAGGEREPHHGGRHGLDRATAVAAAASKFRVTSRRISLVCAKPASVVRPRPPQEGRRKKEQEN